MASISQTDPTAQLPATQAHGEAVGEADRTQEDDTKAILRDYRFWLILVALSVALLLAALESTVIVTTLPTISTELDLGENYVWVANVVMLSR